MAAPIKEILLFNDLTIGIDAEPLNSYFKLKAPSLIVPNSAKWRGYVGKWTIEDNILYLIGLSGFVNNTKIDMPSLFPGHEHKVFAQWFTGEIKIPHCHSLFYHEYGHKSEYDIDWYVDIKNGKVVNTRIIENRGIDIHGKVKLNEFQEKVCIHAEETGEIKESEIKPYWVVSEFDGIGYIIGTFESYEDAEKEQMRLVDAHSISSKTPNTELYEQRMGFQTYKVHESCKYGFHPCKAVCSDGRYSAAIMFANMEGFSIEAFKFERANTIYLFEVGDCEPEKHNFEIDYSFLLAN